MSGEVPHDGFCPSCCALEDEACHDGHGRAVPNHKRRHPSPAASPVTAEANNERTAEDG